MRWVFVFWSSRLELIKAGTVLQPRLQGRPEVNQGLYLKKGTLVNVPVPKQAWDQTVPASCCQMPWTGQYVPQLLDRPDSRACIQSCHPHLGSVSGGSVSRW